MDKLETIPRYHKRFHIIDASHPRKAGTVKDPTKRLQIAVNEYSVAERLPQGYTLIFTHGTSFNKDLWHIVLDAILTRTELKGRIRRVLAIDAVNHGESAALNREMLGSETHWPDHSYDILRTLHHFGVCENIIGVGHSFGGGTMCHAAMIAPSMFTATIFIEPILFQMRRQTVNIAQAAMKRRDTWASLDDVKSSFAKSPGLADWDPRQRQIYSEAGTWETSKGGKLVRMLKTPKEQEAATYLAAPFPHILDLLESSRARHHFVFGEVSKVLSSAQREEVRRRNKTNGKTIVVPGAGHLIPTTHPTELTDLLVGLLVETVTLRDKDQQDGALKL